MNRPRKYFGQHFLHDQNVIRKLISAIAPEPDDHFVEIGPGHGALTRPLLERVTKLDVIEIDRELARMLAEELTNPHLTVHQADALKFDFRQIGAPPEGLRLAGNLPYNISSPLLFHILSFGQIFRDIHVMLQKEVVARMTATPGNKTYGRLTVALAARCQVKSLFDIKPGSFRPAPRVNSSFVRLCPDTRQWSRIDDETSFDRLLRQAFNMRRKRLANALKEMISEKEIESLGIDPDLRAEQITVDSFIQLGNYFASTVAD
ncbi:MAG: 16S rRNA (adenine(1518)-N(6)/adenine(1519)-N(6))-dimethyltransferase RsmA [Gammaproteobacteria bacterium]|nr:16S rRNA (adenine(1518)-N(6)/adenine(1519)-N(6))-dimethyltransferase RsmA [Gammaproteobacteria bacterium]